MSQEEENYITPIFPLDSEEFQEGGASIRNVTQFLDSYSQKIIGNFKKGYTVGVTNTLILPAITEILIRDKAKALVPFKTFNDLKTSKAVPDSLKTSPFFFLNQFFTKTEAMDDLRIKSDPAYDEDKQLLLLEISVRLYVLIYLCVATANSLCASGTKATGDVIFKDFFTNKREMNLKGLIAGLKSRWVDADIQVCLFGVPKDDPGFTGFADFEILCKILYDYALVIYLEGFNYPSDLIKKFQESYYFSSMTEFIQEMEKKVDALPPPPVDDCVALKAVLDDKTKVKDPKAITKEELAAITAAESKYTKDFITECFKKYPAGEYAFAPDAAPPPVDDCVELKKVLDDKTKVKNPKAITKEELAAITAAEPKYTKDFITECFKKYPAGEYAFAPDAAPPPTKSDCEKIKDKLDEAGFVANKKAITVEEVAKLTAIDAKYTRDFVADCLTKVAIFPAGEYALAPVAAPPPTKSDCEKIKDKLDEAGFVANKKAITVEEVAKLTAIDAKYTRDFVADCLTKVAIFPAGEYALAPVAAPPVDDCDELKKVLDDRTKVEDPKAIKETEIAAITAATPKYTKDFIIECLAKKDKFPADKYGFAPAAAPPRANNAALAAKREDLKARFEALVEEVDTVRQLTLRNVNYIHDSQNTFLGKKDDMKKEDADRIGILEETGDPLSALLPRIKTANADNFKIVYDQGLKVLKTILENAESLIKTYIPIAQSGLDAKKTEYDAPLPTEPADAVTAAAALKTEYEKLVAYKKNLDEMVREIPNYTSRLTALQTEFAAVRNAPARGGRKQSRKMNRKTRRANRSRNTRRKNRGT